MKNTEEALESIYSTMIASTVTVEINCQKEEFDVEPRCKEYVVVYTGEVQDFSSERTLATIKSKGWEHRDDGSTGAFNHGVCPNCLSREVQK